MAEITKGGLWTAEFRTGFNSYSTEISRDELEKLENEQKKKQKEDRLEQIRQRWQREDLEREEEQRKKLESEMAGSPNTYYVTGLD